MVMLHIMPVFPKVGGGDVAVYVMTYDNEGKTIHYSCGVSTVRCDGRLYGYCYHIVINRISIVSYIVINT